MNTEAQIRYVCERWHEMIVDRILGIASRHAPTGYWNIVGGANPRKGKLALRKSLRRRKTAIGTKRDQPPRPREVRRLAALDLDAPGTTA